VALIAITGVSLYLVAPSLLSVFSSWPDVRALDPFLLQLIVIAQLGAFACFWGVLRITLDSRRWFPVVTSQLAANGAARVAPGGGAVGNALQYSMLVRAGVPPATAGSGLAAASVLTTGIVLALPALAIPAIVGGGPSTAAWRAPPGPAAWRCSC